MLDGCSPCEAPLTFAICYGQPKTFPQFAVGRIVRKIACFAYQ